MKKKKQKPKSKKRKPKSTKEENKNVSVDKHRPQFGNFLDDMTRWFSDHQLQIDQLFGCCDDTSGSVSLKDLELGLMNMGVPCQQFQLHALTQLLKNPDNTISYQDLSRRVQSLRNSTELCTQISEDFMKAAETENTSCLQKLLKSENQRFIQLSVRLIHFDSVASHPGNFELVLMSSSRVFSLISLIQDRVHIQTSRLQFFRSRVPTEEARLPLESSLEECGFKGGPEESPPEATVYYDYILLFTDCPILNCDHYFSSKPDSSRAALCL